MDNNDKIILLNENETVVIAGDNSNDIVVTAIKNNKLKFSIFEDSTATEIGKIVYNSADCSKNIRIVKFAGKIYLRARKDINNTAPVRIEEKNKHLEIEDIKNGRNFTCYLDLIMTNTDYINGCSMEEIQGEPYINEDTFTV